MSYYVKINQPSISCFRYNTQYLCSPVLVLENLLNRSPKGLSWNYIIAWDGMGWDDKSFQNALGFLKWRRRGTRHSRRYSPFTSLFKNGWKLKFTKRWSSTLLFIGYIVCLSVCYHYLHDWPLLKTLPLHWTILETCDIWDMIRIMRRRNLTIAMAFEALITLLTIEKNNLNIHLWPLNKEWRGQHSLILRCFLQKSNTVWFTLLQCCLHSVSPSDANEKGIGKEQRTEVTNHAMFYVTPEMSQRFFRNHCYLLLGGWLGRDGPWWWMIHHGSWAQQKCTLLQGT